jgi:hypothetical protein
MGSTGRRRSGLRDWQGPRRRNWPHRLRRRVLRLGRRTPKRGAGSSRLIRQGGTGKQRSPTIIAKSFARNNCHATLRALSTRRHRVGRSRCNFVSPSCRPRNGNQGCPTLVAITGRGRIFSTTLRTKGHNSPATF